MLNKIAIALMGSAIMALIATIALSPTIMVARQNMFVAMANHMGLTVTVAAITGFFIGLYLAREIGS